ncbi:TorF family putative porin [Pseudoteredinibacter isoporae]|uniref:Uncharacterized protein (TIGR02001 family) n=1 Tax=Pseudoteredinibacter isoporae TaxID=570281 RepID=A0A7X0MY24_9GAMM|nr:TorF family putative porin [Pseudoteredinibacter isoporae]MBB6523815.1 uncharacterized protein (TIGR02001 family) [Pseudoteredinibacter isoporae]NHO89335.1 hypothetical protein [Pseudoteredinibacter isoporae]NIB22442.1 hypothetical protein [Pseudoteredinibacter isoporae]
MDIRSISLITVLIFYSGQAISAESSANIALLSDYKFRGISQTDTSPAIQGGFDVAFDSGFYVGTWGSNVDFANSLELDIYAGFSGHVSESVSFDVGYLYYDYPGTTGNDDFAEVYASFSIEGFTLGGNYSDDYYNETGEAFYVYGDYEFEIAEGFSLALHYGFSDFDRRRSNAKPGEAVFLGGNADSYTDYNITLNKSFSGINFSLGYYDTDLNQTECGGSDSWCDGSFILSMAKDL